MEVEVPNPGYKLKPGMYARVNLTIEDRKGVLIAPKNAVVDFESKRGVWIPSSENKARFVAVELGIEDSDRVEIKTGLKEGDKIVTTGAAAVKNNDQLVIAGAAGPGGPNGGRSGTGGRGPRTSDAGQRGERGPRPQEQ